MSRERRIPLPRTVEGFQEREVHQSYANEVAERIKALGRRTKETSGASEPFIRAFPRAPRPAQRTDQQKQGSAEDHLRPGNRNRRFAHSQPSTLPPADGESRKTSIAKGTFTHMDLPPRYERPGVFEKDSVLHDDIEKASGGRQLTTEKGEAFRDFLREGFRPEAGVKQDLQKTSFVLGDEERYTTSLKQEQMPDFFKHKDYTPASLMRQNLQSGSFRLSDGGADNKWTTDSRSAYIDHGGAVARNERAIKAKARGFSLPDDDYDDLRRSRNERAAISQSLQKTNYAFGAEQPSFETTYQKEMQTHPAARQAPKVLDLRTSHVLKEEQVIVRKSTLQEEQERVANAVAEVRAGRGKAAAGVGSGGGTIEHGVPVKTQLARHHFSFGNERVPFESSSQAQQAAAVKAVKEAGRLTTKAQPSYSPNRSSMQGWDKEPPSFVTEKAEAYVPLAPQRDKVDSRKAASELRAHHFSYGDVPDASRYTTTYKERTFDGDSREAMRESRARLQAAKRGRERASAQGSVFPHDSPWAPEPGVVMTTLRSEQEKVAGAIARGERGRVAVKKSVGAQADSLVLGTEPSDFTSDYGRFFEKAQDRFDDVWGARKIRERKDDSAPLPPLLG